MDKKLKIIQEKLKVRLQRGKPRHDLASLLNTIKFIGDQNRTFIEEKFDPGLIKKSLTEGLIWLKRHDTYGVND